MIQSGEPAARQKGAHAPESEAGHLATHRCYAEAAEAVAVGQAAEPHVPTR